jgi:hypothetical protein
MTFLVLAAALCAPPPAESGGLTAAVGKDAIAIMDGDRVVTKYVFGGTVQKEKSTDQKPLAKPYFYPLVAPNGVAVTRPWPMERGAKGETVDHFHQKSAWFCHGDVIPEGIEVKTKSAEKGSPGVDFWSEFQTADGKPRYGRIVHSGFDGSPGTAFTETAEWVTPDGVKIMDEVRKVAFGKTAQGYLIRLDTELKATVCPITFGDTKEGSMGIRIRDDFALNSKTGDGGVITSSDGPSFKHGAKDNLPIWGRPADWHDYSGTADGKTAGIAIFDHPQNKYRAAWHTRVYGLMAANPFGRDKSGFPSQKGKTDLVKIPKGESLKLTYALYVHDGDATAGKVAEAYKEFVK